MMNNENVLLKNHILLLFKMFVYTSRSTGTIVLSVFLVKLSKVKHREKIASGNNNKKLKKNKGIALRRKSFAILLISKN